jgi:uncharacterized protein
MTPGWPDHLYVASVLLLIFPVGGWLAYRRFLARAERIGGRALVQEYRYTLIWLAGLAAGALLVWQAQGRAIADLFAVRPLSPDGPDIAQAMVIGAGIVLLVRPVLAMTSGRLAALFFRQMEPLAAFLPRTVEQLGWGLAVSLAAGLCEEIAYRGYLMPYLGHWLPVPGVFVGTALIFGIAHAYQGRMGVLATTLLGGGFGAIYWESGSLAWPILLHALLDVSAMFTAFVVLRRRS